MEEKIGLSNTETVAPPSHRGEIMEPWLVVGWLPDKRHSKTNNISATKTALGSGSSDAGGDSKKNMRLILQQPSRSNSWEILQYKHSSKQLYEAVTCGDTSVVKGLVSEPQSQNSSWVVALHC